MATKFVILLIFQFAGIILGQVINDGDCPEVSVIKNFDAAKYLGTWYEWERYYTLHEVNTRCNSGTYTLNDDGTVHLINRASNAYSDGFQEVEGSAVQKGPDGVLEVTIGNAQSSLYILDTDYENWAAVYSCETIGDGITGSFAWLVTRERIPSNDAVEAAKEVFVSQNIKLDFLLPVNQTDCD